MTLNAAGTQNYNNDLIQNIVYNENNDPVFIDGMKGDVSFQYGLTNMRQRVTYGGILMLLEMVNLLNFIVRMPVLKS